MEKWKGIVLGFTLTGLLLSGCGTSVDDEATEGSNEEKIGQKAEQPQNNQNGSSMENKTESGMDDSQKNKEQSGTVRIMEKNLQYELNGETKEETAFLKSSENQGYTMYILPAYELNEEEPGKDILTLKGKEEVSMRIELLPEDVNWTETEENTVSFLKAVSDTVNPVTEKSLTVENGLVQEAEKGDERVTAVLIKDKETPVRLTMFTVKDADHRKAFLEMGKTIVKTK
ncbi:hypothetical protein [Peribacillus glennii]|uniref:Lipoprotein n=1 Tax=Peribacillus glennii TaxID=2303991 RepID=A0A372LCX7_9BACI|nr:hypothetical protein [Peribacillus glennii]RFU63473.1 hypothetical protein D0466_12130 [Peribacillus glennii]